MKVDRIQNRAADFLAKFSRSEHQNDLWLQDAHEKLLGLLAMDCNTVH